VDIRGRHNIWPAFRDGRTLSHLKRCLMDNSLVIPLSKAMISFYIEGSTMHYCIIVLEILH